MIFFHEPIKKKTVRLIDWIHESSFIFPFFFSFFVFLSDTVKNVQFANLIWTKNWQRHDKSKCVHVQAKCKCVCMFVFISWFNHTRTLFLSYLNEDPTTKFTGRLCTLRINSANIHVSDQSIKCDSIHNCTIQTIGGGAWCNGEKLLLNSNKE